MTGQNHYIHLTDFQPYQRQSAPTGAQEPENQEGADRPLGDAACSALPVFGGLVDAGIGFTFRVEKAPDWGWLGILMLDDGNNFFSRYPENVFTMASEYLKESHESQPESPHQMEQEGETHQDVIEQRPIPTGTPASIDTRLSGIRRFVFGIQDEIDAIVQDIRQSQSRTHPSELQSQDKQS
jgi:hypothetical protein